MTEIDIYNKANVKMMYVTQDWHTAGEMLVLLLWQMDALQGVDLEECGSSCRNDYTKMALHKCMYI